MRSGLTDSRVKWMPYSKQPSMSPLMSGLHNHEYACSASRSWVVLARELLARSLQMVWRPRADRPPTVNEEITGRPPCLCHGRTRRWEASPRTSMQASPDAGAACPRPVGELTPTLGRAVTVAPVILRARLQHAASQYDRSLPVRYPRTCGFPALPAAAVGSN